MSSFLISFHFCNDSGGFALGSHVWDLPTEPSTQQALADLQVSLGMEYQVNNVGIVNCDFLPDRYAHPAGSSPYWYQVAFVYGTVGARGSGFGSRSFYTEEPICTLTAVRAVEVWLEADQSTKGVCLLGCKALGS